MGTLLAASLAGGGTRPLLGMLAFASGLALPFFFLALFPSYVKRLPRSGGWMERVKVVMGLVILAVMVKYLSAIDQVMQWGVLTRERFLAAWVVLFAMAGCYLLGWLRLHGSEPGETVGTTRLAVGALFFIFAVSLIPGMFGARLGELDAYVPAAQVAGETAWLKNRYREALDGARLENRRLLVVFTGYACTNCHWMKANLFARPEVAAALKDFILLELYTDGTDDASAANQQLQETRFATVAIPYYAILDAHERVLSTFAGLTRDTAEFLRFLRAEAGR
jgi:thiol:disulfide interchange protein DsbD